MFHFICSFVLLEIAHVWAILLQNSDDLLQNCPIHIKKTTEQHKAKLHDNKESYDFQVSTNIPTIHAMLYPTEEKFHVLMWFFRLSTVKKTV
jgi:hypothetical protein